MFDLLVLGGLGVDIRVRVPAIPMPPADSVTVPPIDLRIGNTGSGVALAAHAIGLRVMVVDIVGSDPTGDVVRAALARTSISSVLRDDPRGTRRSVNLVDPGGRRMSLYDPRGEWVGAGAFDAAELASLIGDARHVHVSIMDWLRDLAPAVRAACRAAGVSFSTDLHDWDGSNDYHRPFLSAADVVFVSAVALADRADHVAAELSGRTSVITNGAAGATLTEPDGTTTPIDAALPPRPVVDTNGAGDAFVAGFVAGRLKGLGAARASTYAAAVAAAACTHDGMEYPAGLLPAA